jgi:hypothetical protein
VWYTISAWVGVEEVNSLPDQPNTSNKSQNPDCQESNRKTELPILKPENQSKETSGSQRKASSAPETTQPTRSATWVKYKASEANFAEWMMAFFTLAITAATIFYTIYAKRQWGAMLKSNQINRSAIVIGQRAFVFISNTNVDSGHDVTGKKAWLFTPRMENGGNTAALEVRNYVNQNSPDYGSLPTGFEYSDRPYPKGAFPNTNVKGGPAIIGPHRQIDMAGLGVAEDVLQRVNKGTAHVYFWGWVSYQDIFGCEHKTEFCEEVVAMSPDGHFVFNNCSEHNCADSTCKDYAPTQTPICSLAPN